VRKLASVTAPTPPFGLSSLGKSDGSEGSEHIDTALLIQSQGLWYNARMRKNRFIGQDRCYHLVSRLAHRAFFLDDEEKDRAVALMRRVEEFVSPCAAARRGR